ncbi:MAG: CoB--CoM heterodisulfide reductase iron-sulfur subunit A family protein [Candidatus Lokiarchaeota archaeon]|nr:CoB--CoM heterodisulfide reductase iron-sulfur subunit A family protein [Candidatus Lokiarchaeota archaeon]
MDNEKIRIGVFICHCGSNIANTIDCENLAVFARSLPNVVFTQDNLYTCSETGLSQIKNGIEENKLNRVLVAACTPRTHEPLFRNICNEKGLNPYYFEFVNIREQCSWVHQKDKEQANAKARDLIRMGVARATLLESLSKNTVDVLPSAVVIGGGIAGMTATLNLANQGFEVKLIEKEDKLGGRLNYLYSLFPDDIEPSKVLNIIKLVMNHKNIEVLLSSQVINIEGYIGNFKIIISKENKKIKYNSGCIIIATGTQVLQPEGMYSYDGIKVINQQELELQFLENIFNSKNIVMIQCVGSRDKERLYCSNVCCMTALKNAKIIKQKNSNANIFILFRDIYSPGIEFEQYYKDVRDLGVIFIKYDPKRPAIVEKDKIIIHNEYLNENLELKYDLIVLSTPLIANSDSKILAQMVKVPLEENGFFLEAHVKLRPIDFATDGIFVCGSTKWPSNVQESISQGIAAAARVSTILSKSKIEVEGNTAFVNKNQCIGCEICIKICPFGAIFKDDEGVAYVQEVLCKGCGTCGATCPHQAIIIRHYKDEQILSQILSLSGSG